MGKPDEERAAASIADEAERSRALRTIAEKYCRDFDFPGALGVAASIPLPRHRAQALLGVGQAQQQARKKTAALRIYGEVQELLSVDGGKIARWERAELLGELGRLLRDAGEEERAKTVWAAAVAVARKGEADPSPDDSLEASSVLWGIAETMAKAGQLDEAQRAAESILHPRQKARALEAVARIRRG